MDVQQRAELLAGVNVFSGLESSQLRLLAEAFTEHRCEPGEHLMDEGERGRMLTVIVSGAVRVYLPAGGGAAHRPEAVELAELVAGDVFGEYSFIDLRPASATVDARGDTLLLQVPQDRLHHLLDEHAEIASRVYYNLLLTLIDRLRRDDQELDTFSLAWG